MNLPQATADIQRLIASPYPDSVQAPLPVSTVYDSDANFFRNRPNRKIVVFESEYGDETESDLATAPSLDDAETQFDDWFSCLETEVVKLLPTAPVHRNGWPADLPSAADFDDEEKEDTPLEGPEGCGLCWTSTYEGGLQSFDESVHLAFDLGTDYLVLMRAKTMGDGNWALMLFACVLPKRGGAASGEAAARVIPYCYAELNPDPQGVLALTNHGGRIAPREVTHAKLSLASETHWPALLGEAANLQEIEMALSGDFVDTIDWSHFPILSKLDISSDTCFSFRPGISPQGLSACLQEGSRSVRHLILCRLRGIDLETMRRCLLAWHALEELHLFDCEFKQTRDSAKALFDQLRSSPLKSLRLTRCNLFWRTDRTRYGKSLGQWLPGVACIVE